MYVEDTNGAEMNAQNIYKLAFKATKKTLPNECNARDNKKPLSHK